MRLDKFDKKTEAFIETGSHVGLGIDLAILSGFSEIYSIELVEIYYLGCVEKFKDVSKVNLILGDSFYELGKILKKNPNKPFTYWLDGHFSGDDTGFGVKETPLMKELETILERNIDGELIYVDDMRLYRNFDEETNIEKIYELLKKYKRHGKIHYLSSPHDIEDILVIDY